MWEIVIIVGFAFMVISASLFIGYFKGIADALDMMEGEERLYCFECGMDMPVKEKNGRFYCSNCGLYHGSKI